MGLEATKNCAGCGYWARRGNRRRGVAIPDGVGKCTRSAGHCDPDVVKGYIGEGPRVRRAELDVEAEVRHGLSV